MNTLQDATTGEIATLASVVAETPELAEALQTLSSISENLLASYTTLAARAERIERQLAATNDELEAVLRALPTGVVVRDGSGRIRRANPVACAILGTREHELVEAGTHPLLLERQSSGQSRELVQEDGSVRIVEQRCSPICGPQGSDAGSVEILDDRTQVVRLTERLYSMDKMAALGTIAAGIAHEIRNPLNAVRGFAELLRRDTQGDVQRGRWATRICEGVDEADAIISSMLSFGAPERLRRESLDGSELIADAVALARRSLPSGSDAAKWKITSENACSAFLGDRIKLRQALRNLVANALEAQPVGGSVHVGCRLDGAEVVFDVYDAGPGIAPEHRRRVADPFFTTRAEGTGLGLALVHTIAELHGGRFEVSHTPAPRQHGGGAHMILSLPYSINESK
ncbi:MAG: PAS domain-containing protein [Planctomycetes bacterium]|nr:PAS domain-containing protein [Planctomycetota bacterium]